MRPASRWGQFCSLFVFDVRVRWGRPIGRLWALFQDEAQRRQTAIQFAGIWASAIDVPYSESALLKDVPSRSAVSFSPVALWSTATRINSRTGEHCLTWEGSLTPSPLNLVCLSVSVPQLLPCAIRYHTLLIWEARKSPKFWNSGCCLLLSRFWKWASIKDQITRTKLCAR